MNEREFDFMLERLMKQDFAAGTERFRDALLVRCLNALGSDGHASPTVADTVEIGAADLELLAAAGDATALERNLSFGDNGTNDPTRKEN